MKDRVMVLCLMLCEISLHVCDLMCMCLSVLVYVQIYTHRCLGIQCEPLCVTVCIHANVCALINFPPTGLKSSVVRPR